ncbi:hypothetical protein LTR10_019348 [Elasticomyces elasticus]|uniref:Uncharacterized protein n=1 Tax=Exophiala sideris TaxID=1016849 RepID=A0ABR0J2H2_9EURO|nr:hypothetical protein LTR10_019348 [Elasticomyces elasticus]KAK5024349.1 hypothetical protein LTS07_008640 [Exophiala sideris]KAK5030969.1 hypothetical protein LTR13_007982 [Exophiala sideris]KAK5054082.1 hypothetical protein LTR69_009044 [Exophiala sideris]KAK5179562.1 hypothetical protein LTR44_008078 [Eurotiomycetes sp. CCFEE 6388]
MGLFGHKNEPTPAQAAPPRHSTSSSEGSRGGFFSRGRDPSPEYNDSRNGSKLSSGSRRSGGLLHRNQEDPSIVDARQRVASAEAAEREADRALVQARTAVRDAREHVKRIEMEAAEEARLAKIKQQNARDISKRAKPLGRHDHY